MIGGILGLLWAITFISVWTYTLHLPRNLAYWATLIFGAIICGLLGGIVSP